MYSIGSLADCGCVVEEEEGSEEAAVCWCVGFRFAGGAGAEPALGAAAVVVIVGIGFVEDIWAGVKNQEGREE